MGLQLQGIAALIAEQHYSNVTGWLKMRLVAKFSRCLKQFESLACSTKLCCARFAMRRAIPASFTPRAPSCGSWSRSQIHASARGRSTGPATRAGGKNPKLENERSSENPWGSRDDLEQSLHQWTCYRITFSNNQQRCVLR